MATYIVGDIQGCLDELQLLLKQVGFSTETDTIWFAGDLVARGPKSLETLRFVHDLGDVAKVVLGNHDLHLLAVAIGVHPIKNRDKTAAIFDASDRDTLLNWLRKQPLLLEHEEFLMCHAGISPQWNMTTARQAAKEVEAILQSDHWMWLIEQMYSDTPEQWNEQLIGIDRYRYIINSFTRMRYCFSDGRLDMACKLPPSQVKNGLLPWFNLKSRITLDKTVIFGHWAALEGYFSEGVIGLDTGCVWGGELTMLRWEDKQLFTQPSLTTKNK